MSLNLLSLQSVCFISQHFYSCNDYKASNGSMILNDELNTMWAWSWASPWGGDASPIIFLPKNNFLLLWS